MNKYFLIGVTALLLVGCGSTNIQNPTSLPTLIEYSDEFKNTFADELDVICEKGKEKSPNTCLFIQDAIELRAAVRAAQEE